LAEWVIFSHHRTQGLILSSADGIVILLDSYGWTCCEGRIAIDGIWKMPKKLLWSKRSQLIREWKKYLMRSIIFYNLLIVFLSWLKQGGWSSFLLLLQFALLQVLQSNVSIFFNTILVCLYSGFNIKEKKWELVRTFVSTFTVVVYKAIINVVHKFHNNLILYSSSYHHHHHHHHVDWKCKFFQELLIWSKYYLNGLYILFCV
jgi:hypothetical protein